VTAAVTVRNTRREDFDGVQALCKKVYPWLRPWPTEYLESHLEVFPEGQFVALEPDGTIVGMSASLIITWHDYDLSGSYKEFIGSGKFANHDPENGRTLYGAEIMTDPALRGRGIGKALYAARRELCRSLALPRIRAGGRLPDYHKYADELTPEQFVIEVVNKRLADPTLGFQLSQGFRVFAVISDYMADPESLGFAALIEWINREAATPDDYARRDPRFEPPAGLWPE
jgi:ribosomal protein S18 acetylase RimI-like enzyme